jgi:HSP20 family protein
MPARDANRGRGGRAGAESRSTTAGGRQPSAAAASARSGSTSGARGGEPGGGRASSRTTRNAQPSRAAGAASASSGRAGGGGASAAGSEGGASGAMRDAGTPSINVGKRGGRTAAGASTGIGAGGLASEGISTASSSAPRTGDVEVTRSAGGPTSETARTSERQRDREPVREGPGTAGQASASTAGGRQLGTGVAGRAQSSPALATWVTGADNPFAMMRRMEEDLGRVFRAFGIPRLGAAFAPPREFEELLARTPALTQVAQWSPQIEVFEREGDLVVHADLPGVKRDDVEVNVDNDVLTIRGERRQEHRETEGGYRRTERSYGTFFRQIPLPEGVDPEQVQASYQDGVLEVVVPSPRGEQQRRKRIEVR